MWTLVGAGIKDFQQSQGQTEKYLPAGVDWIKQSVSGFDPDNNTVHLDTGGTVRGGTGGGGEGVQIRSRK
jgi:sulfide:quinone oxidoreductase